MTQASITAGGTTVIPSAADARPREVDATTLGSWRDQGRAVIIDVREPDEHAAERIAGSVLHPLSKFDPARVPSPGAGREVVLHCRSGTRSAEAAARLVAAGRSGIIQLRGGLEAWKAAGLPVERPLGRVPISIMRQVQIVVGTLVLAGSALAWLVSPWFLALTAFFGGGLLFAGTTGMCGLAFVLSFMPWNRAVRACVSPPA